MKINTKNIKMHARKIKNATEEELKKTHEAYEQLLGKVERMSSNQLLAIAVVGAFIVLLARSNFIDLIGLIVLVYPFFLFVQRESHEEGFFEGYYDLLNKDSDSE